LVYLFHLFQLEDSVMFMVGQLVSLIDDQNSVWVVTSVSSSGEGDAVVISNGMKKQKVPAGQLCLPDDDGHPSLA